MVKKNGYYVQRMIWRIIPIKNKVLRGAINSYIYPHFTMSGAFIDMMYKKCTKSTIIKYATKFNTVYVVIKTAFTVK